SGWEISTTSGGSTYTALSLPYTVAYTDNGKNIRYYATNGCGTTYSNVVAITVNPLPGTPTATAATDVTCSSFLANWTAATNATGYYLDVSTVNNFSSIVAAYNNLDIGLVSSYNVTGLTKKTTYFYRLRAYNSCGTSVSSNYIQIKTLDVATATISGTTTVCKDAASPAITFTNSEDNAITVTYNINGGTNLTINVGANATATVSAPTGTSGTFVYNLVSAVYQSVTTCLTSLSGSATVTVRSTPTATISGTTTVCQGVTSPNVTFTNPLSLPVTVTYNVNGGTNATVNVAANASSTVAVSTGASGVFTYNLVSVAYQSGSGCSATLIGSAVVTINSVSTAPTVGTITNISCTTNTGSVVLSGLPTTGTWSITSTPATVTTPGSGSSTTISGLGLGSYTFTVTNTSGCPSAASASVTISDFSSTTWNGSGWSNGLPDATKNLIIASSSGAPFAADLAGCALTVNNGIVASVPSGVTLTITNAVTVTGTGSLTFENTASLVQINHISNSGAIVYKRNSAPMKNFDYTYWSSPVAGQTLYNLSPNTLWDKYFSFSGTAWVQITNGAGTMEPGIGYIIRVPKPNSTYTNGKDNWTGSSYVQPVEFIGVPNNGNITSSQTMVAGNLYLIGNPYPCAMDADEFLFTNLHNRAILEGTIYFWTHNTAITPTGTQYKYTSDDYASYNLTGGTGTAASSSGNKTVPDGYVAAGQSFFATAQAPGSVEFNNSMRAVAYNSTFFKPGKTSKSVKLEKHRLWLNMINSEGAYKQALIGYIEGATNSFDKSFDGLSFDGNSYIDFYSVNAADNYVIQGRALPFNDTDVVPLGYRSTVAGDFTIAIDHADGNLATQRVYLEDKQTGIVNELTAGNYTFNTKAGTFNNRFVLKYTNRTLGTGDFETEDNSISVITQNKTITINSVKDNLEKVFIYDVTGKQLYTKDNVNNLQLIMQNLPFAQQVLLVKIFLENGTVTTKKVIFK
ncbi:T9SS sorting signal type C domain-containing protein, partial [Flavobacterium ajazii]|uniref:T9SS sorting signal type C domain-containing protein n=1 Tax=Flavobacterium ajazii TaxID=2692318 RepID=UPI0013D788A1